MKWWKLRIIVREEFHLKGTDNIFCKYRKKLSKSIEGHNYRGKRILQNTKSTEQNVFIPLKHDNKNSKHTKNMLRILRINKEY